MKTRISFFLFLILTVLTVSLSAHAQNPQRDWGRVQKTALGTDLFVYTSAGKTVKGSLRAVDGTRLELNTKGRGLSISKDDVKAVYLAVPKTGKRGRIIGAISGLFVGGLAGGLINKDAILEEDYNWSSSMLLTIGGMVGGSVVGGRLAKGKKRGPMIY